MKEFLIVLAVTLSVYSFGYKVGAQSDNTPKQPECIAYQYETGKPVCAMYYGQTKPTGKQQKEIAPNLIMYRDCDERTAVAMFDDGRTQKIEFNIDCEVHNVQE